MALNNQQRGRIFEWFVRRILINCGFTQVVDDGRIVYKGPSGLMVHGLGQPHNTDVLVSPPFQIPFFYPSRLIIECKCYLDPVGLPDIRGTLGLREDINNFEIITQDILNKRKNYRRQDIAAYNMERYVYQTAVAAISGFTFPAQEFALVHRIPLINIERIPFCKQFKDVLFNDKIQINKEVFQKIFSEDIPLTDHSDYKWVNDLKELMRIIENKFCVGVLQSGDLLFLYTDNDEKWVLNAKDIELHWSSDKRLWQITPRQEMNRTKETWFELPDILFEQWAEMKFDRENALRMKESYFKYIYIMGRDTEGVARLQVIRLSKEFIDEAREHLKKNRS